MQVSGFLKASRRVVAAAILFVLFQIVWSPAGSVSPAHAQTNVACPDATAPPGTIDVFGDIDTGTCVSPSAGTNNGVQFVIIPATTQITFTLRVGAFQVVPTSVTCPGLVGNIIPGAVQTVMQFTDAVGDNACNFTTTGTVNGFAVTMTGTATFTDATNTIATTSTVFTFGIIGDNRNRSNIVAGLQNSLNAVTPGLLEGGGLPLNGNGGGGGNGLTFLPTGLGFSQSRINSANPMDRHYGAAFAERDFFTNRIEGHRNNGFNFSMNLQQMATRARARSAEETAALGARAADMKGASGAPQSRFNSWAEGRYVDFDDDETNADRDGDLWTVTSGLSYQVGSRTTVGVFSRYREGEVDSIALNASLDAEAWGGGAFVAATLGNGLGVAVAALYEGGDNDIVIAGDTGSFDSNQTTIEGRIDKRFARGRHWVEPVVKLLYVDTDQDDYTDSAGNFVLGQDLTLGRLTYGPTIGTTIQHGQTQIRPFAKVNGVWDFENEGNFTTTIANTGGAVFTTGDNALNLGGGVEVQYAGGIAIRLAGDWFTFDSDLDGWALSGGVGAPLSAFGIGSAGTVSLSLASNVEDANAKAQIRIPLGKAN